MKHFFYFFFSFILFSCNSLQTHPAGLKTDSTLSVADDPNMDGLTEDTITCEDLLNKEVILNFANEAMSNVGLLDVDTSDLFMIEGHFIDSKTTQTLVWIQAYGLPSSGNGANLVLLFSCDNKAELIFSTISGVFTKEDVRDLDNDGVLEIISESGICRMGECHANYEIFNLADTIHTILYKAHSFSYIDEAGWGDNYAGYFEKGDTIRDSITSVLIDQVGDHVFKIKQVRKIDTYHGGKTIAEINKEMKTIHNSSIIPLKKISLK